LTIRSPSISSTIRSAPGFVDDADGAAVASTVAQSQSAAISSMQWR
jgi:hypothetical protein